MSQRFSSDVACQTLACRYHHREQPIAPQQRQNIIRILSLAEILCYDLHSSGVYRLICSFIKRVIKVCACDVWVTCNMTADSVQHWAVPKPRPDQASNSYSVYTVTSKMDLLVAVSYCLSAHDGRYRSGKRHECCCTRQLSFDVPT